MGTLRKTGELALTLHVLPRGLQACAYVSLCPCSAPAQALTCGRTTVLRVLRESDSPFNAVFLHLFNCFFCQRMDVPEANVVFVRRCQPKHRKRNCRKKPQELNNTSLISTKYRIRQTETAEINLSIIFWLLF